MNYDDLFKGAAPTEASGEMRAFAAMMWQMFTALVQEGFSEGQALAILGQTIAASFAANRGGQ